MSTGLDGLPSAFEPSAAAEEQPAGTAAAASLSRAATPVGPLERASSLTAALPQQSAA